MRSDEVRGESVLLTRLPDWTLPSSVDLSECRDNTVISDSVLVRFRLAVVSTVSVKEEKDPGSYKKYKLKLYPSCLNTFYH